MILLLERKEILRINSTFTAFIAKYQLKMNDPFYKNNATKPGEMYDPELGEVRYYTQEECDLINSKRLDEYNKGKDQFEPGLKLQPFVGTTLFNYPQAPIKTYIRNLAVGLTHLTGAMGWKYLIFMLELGVPWLYQENDYPPVAAALNYLRSLGADDHFTGGIIANGQELKALLPHLFWIFRCNASLAPAYFTGMGIDMVGSICKYGNLHLYWYNEAQKEAFIKQAPAFDLTLINSCYEGFSETGSIKGRKIKLKP